jgi:hypothetical protein
VPILLAAFVLLVASGTAFGDKVKDCGTTATSPNNNAQGTPLTTTTTQTSSCNNNSDTGQTTTTFNGGGQPEVTAESAKPATLGRVPQGTPPRYASSCRRSR